MLNSIVIKPISTEDYQFDFDIKKLILMEYIKKTWGKWNEEQQIEFYKKNFKLENNYVILYDSIKIGWLEIIEMDTFIEINQIFILPEYQGKGIGSKIIMDIIEKGITGKKEVKLQVLKCNNKALKLYKKLGFTEYNETKTHYQLKK